MTDNPSYQPALPSHPEEIKAEWELRFGKFLSIRASARCTPAGVVTAGLAASAVLLAIGVMLRGRRS